MMKKTSRTSHVLTTLGVLFVAGGILRVLPSASADQTRQDAEAESTESTAISLPARHHASTEMCDESIAELFAPDVLAQAEATESLRLERLELLAREQELARREADLEALQDMLREQWQTLSTVAADDIRHLANMYAAMKSDEAAIIFNQMDPTFAAGFLREMPGEAAGHILADMVPEKAYQISIEIASRGADIRTAVSERSSLRQP